MSSAFIWLVCATVALGISNILFQKSAQSMGAASTTFWYYIFGSFFSGMLYWNSEQKVNLNFLHLKWPFLIALFLCISVYGYTRSLDKIPITIAATIRSLSFIVTLVLGYVATAEVLTCKQLLGIFFIGIALFLFI